MTVDNLKIWHDFAMLAAGDMTSPLRELSAIKTAVVIPPKANRIKSKNAGRAKNYTEPLNTSDHAGHSGQTCQAVGL